MKNERPTMSEELYRNLGWGRRKNLRRHFGYPAQMRFEEGVPSRACVIIDMSETGAHVRRQCRLVWRSRNRIGVQFRVGVKDGGAPTARRPVVA